MQISTHHDLKNEQIFGVVSPEFSWFPTTFLFHLASRMHDSDNYHQSVSPYNRPSAVGQLYFYLNL